MADQRPSASRIAWLTARPIAHRGLHDAAAGIIENTGAAATAAIAAGYGMEIDLQVSADGEAMVHHDPALGRLIDGAGALRDLSAAALSRVDFRATEERMLTLGALLDVVAGRVPLFVELKSRFDGDMRLAVRTAALLAHYAGPVAVMSFDPAVVAELRRIAPRLVRGIVAERHYGLPHWDFLHPWRKRALACFSHGLSSRPDFIAYRIDDLTAVPPRLARSFGMPVLTWTVRTTHERMTAARYADQIVFEGFLA